LSLIEDSQMSHSRVQRAQAPRMPARPSTAGLYRLCLAQRPSNFLDRTFKRTPTAGRCIETYCIPRLTPAARYNPSECRQLAE
jgi:hypothetical protein